MQYGGRLGKCNMLYGLGFGLGFWGGLSNYDFGAQVYGLMDEVLRSAVLHKC